MRHRSYERLQNLAAGRGGTDITISVLYGALALIAAFVFGTLSYRPF
jgi:hypothetical protein